MAKIFTLRGKSKQLIASDEEIDTRILEFNSYEAAHGAYLNNKRSYSSWVFWIDEKEDAENL